jgi:lipoyl(octanoyl) transferase
MTAPWSVIDLGLAPYREVRERQLAEVARRQAGLGDDVLLLVEHPEVITVGRKREALDNVLAPGAVEVVEIERGGDATYHGPGQLVAYPIVLLREGERDLHRFLRNLEAAVIAALGRLGLAADREPEKTGVWLGPAEARRKICSLGIACRRWVTFHGLALNVTTDLSRFATINPCGFEATVMTSVAAQGHGASVAEIKPVLAEELGIALGRAAR